MGDSSAATATAVASTAVQSDAVQYPRYDDTNLFEMVNLVCDLTARDLKNQLSIKGSSAFVEVASKQGTGSTVQVDLVKLAKFLPTHLIAAVCKPESKYWNDGHISRGMKSLLHLTRLGKKKTGPLEQEIHNNLKKYVDLCFFTTISAIRQACDAPDATRLEMCLEVSRICILLLDFMMDSELDRTKQPFIDCFISHPKLDVFVASVVDVARLILEHRDVFPLKGDRYNAIVTKALVSIFDAMDIFCMSEDYVEILVDKSTFLPLVDALVAIMQDTKHTQAVIYSALKLLFRLLEERPQLLEMVASSAAASRFQQLVTFIIDTAANYLEEKAKFNDEIRLEAVRITQILADDRQYKRNVLERGTASILKFFSVHPSVFPDEFKNHRTVATHLTKTIANLHAVHPQTVVSALQPRRFVDDIIDAAKEKGGLLLKKSLCNPRTVYVPHFVQNINYVLSEILLTAPPAPGLRSEFSRAEVANLLSFRRDIEKSLGLNSGKQLDSDLDRKLKEWEISSANSSSVNSSAAGSTASSTAATPSQVGKRGRSSNGSKQQSSVDESNDKRKGRPPKRKKPGMAPGAESAPNSSFNGNLKSGADLSAPVSPDSAPIMRSGKGGPLDGLTFRVGKAVDTTELQDMITNAGGMILQYITKHTTHYLTTLEEYEDGGPHISAAIKKPIFIVGPEFVHDCVKENRRVSEEPYRVDKIR